MLVELGPGTNPHPRMDVGVDLHHPHPVTMPKHDATVTPWPYTGVNPGGGWQCDFPAGGATEVFCSHFLEHVPAGQPRIDVFNEAWRVLASGGTFTMILPLIGYTDPTTGEPKSDQIGWQPWADPTHVSQWWFPESLYYFCQGPFKAHANYGIAEWAPLDHYLTEDDASKVIEQDRQAGALQIGPPSFWSVRQGWEGVARMTKP